MIKIKIRFIRFQLQCNFYLRYKALYIRAQIYFQKFQYYGDGYKMWHTEHIPDEPMNKRVLVWMFYLNNAKSGTQFIHYPTVQAKKGRLIIWPSAFTHTHRSEPNKGLKYIMSGWISYVNPDSYEKLEKKMGCSSGPKIIDSSIHMSNQ